MPSVLFSISYVKKRMKSRSFARLPSVSLAADQFGSLIGQIDWRQR